MQQKQINDIEWSLVISPKKSIFDLQLSELWKYRDLILLFVRRDFVAAYKQTILGPLWHFIQPVLTTLMFLMIFKKIANIPTDNIHPVLFYMSGITIWNYFSACLNGTSNTFVGNAGIFGKVYFPRLALPVSVVISNVMRFAIQFLLLICTILFFVLAKGVSIHFGWSWLLIFPLLLVMAVLGLGLGIIISSLTTKYRDMGILIGFGVQLLMYASPIAYPLSFLTGKSYGWIVKYNPLTSLVELFRYAIFQQGTFSVNSIIYSVTFTLLSLFVGLLIFNKVERGFMDTV